MAQIYIWIDRKRFCAPARQNVKGTSAGRPPTSEELQILHDELQWTSLNLFDNYDVVFDSHGERQLAVDLYIHLRQTKKRSGAKQHWYLPIVVTKHRSIRLVSVRVRIRKVSHYIFIV